MRCLALLSTCLATFLVTVNGLADSPGAGPRVDTVLTLLDEAEVPAREAGLLREVAVREGQAVEQGDLLALVADTRARGALERASIELEKARRLAENDLKVRLARGVQEIAQLELRRGLDAYDRVRASVSRTELDRLKLLARKADLELEQAEIELRDAQLNVRSRENDLQLAEHEVARRQVIAPFAGVVVEVRRHRGEWVEPGQTVLRLAGTNRLRAEGLVDADCVDGKLVGRPVTLTFRGGDQLIEAAGTVIFVSPEVQPIGGKVRLWAEIDNRGLGLRPGLTAEMSVE